MTKRLVLWSSRLGLVSLAIIALQCGANGGGQSTTVDSGSGAGGAGLGSSDASMVHSSAGRAGNEQAGERADGSSSPGWLATDLEAGPNDGALVKQDALTPDSACVAEKRLAEQRPLDLYFMLDKTGSMNCETGPTGVNCPGTSGVPVPTRPTRWNALSDALKAFVKSPANVGKGAGIGLFPRPGEVDEDCMAKCSDCTCAASCGCGQSLCLCLSFLSYCLCDNMILEDNVACNSRDYATPDVGIGLLPDNGQAIVAAIDAAKPSGSTPTTASLEGAIQYVKSWAASHTDRTAALVYATDGEPEGCDTATNTVANAAAIAKDALQGAKTRTFVLGAGPHLDSLNEIAAAGGTEKAYLVDMDANVARQFAEALDSIRTKAVSCDYRIPASDAGTLDFGFVNVLVKPEDAGAGTLVKWVQSPDGCQAPQGGWYYDNYQNPSASPSLIQLCPSTCDQLKGSSMTSLEVLIGCQRTEKDPQIK